MKNNNNYISLTNSIIFLLLIHLNGRFFLRSKLLERSLFKSDRVVYINISFNNSR